MALRPRQVYHPTRLSTGADPLAIGKKVHCEMEGFTFDATITVCERPAYHFVHIVYSHPLLRRMMSRHFSGRPSIIWPCSWPAYLPESSATPGATVFSQTEEYLGIGKFLMSQAPLGGGVKKQFEKFNADFKAKVEK